MGSMAAQDVCDLVRVSYGLLSLPFRQQTRGGGATTVTPAIMHIVIGRAV